MLSRTEDYRKRITAARTRIRELFRDQCKNGQQTVTLTEQKGAACGQFLEVLVRSQRGIHGTASAISVLADDTALDSINLVRRLVHYIQTRETCERGEKCQRDKENVIKVSETIFALKVVPQTTINTTDYATTLAEPLRKLIKNDRGWSYFLDDTDDPEPLPTAYACLALKQLGNDAVVDNARKFLLEHLRTRYLNAQWDNSRRIDTMTDVFCLYVVTKTADASSGTNERAELKGIFECLWDHLCQLMQEDLEQNIEYWHQESTCYIRVPWQLYLLSLAAEYSFRKRFSTLLAQHQVESILDQVTGSGFRYPHSGKFLSARTYAIVFELLGQLQAHLSRENLSNWLLCLDIVKRTFQSAWARWTVRVALCLLIGFLIWQAWPLNGRNDYAGLLINLVSPFILTCQAWSSRRR